MTCAKRDGSPNASARAWLALGLCVAASAAAGCSAFHFNHPGRTAACAQALPTAFDSVHHRGQLVGFRVVKGVLLRAVDPSLSPPVAQAAHPHRAYHARTKGPPRQRPPAPPAGVTPSRPVAAHPSGPLPGNRKACLIVFKGDFSSAQVFGALPADHGHYAVLLIFVRHATVVRTRLVDQLPLAIQRLL